MLLAYVEAAAAAASAVTAPPVVADVTRAAEPGFVDANAESSTADDDGATVSTIDPAASAESAAANSADESAAAESAAASREAGNTRGPLRGVSEATSQCEHGCITTAKCDPRARKRAASK